MKNLVSILQNCKWAMQVAFAVQVLMIVWNACVQAA